MRHPLFGIEGQGLPSTEWRQSSCPERCSPTPPERTCIVVPLLVMSLVRNSARDIVSSINRAARAIRNTGGLVVWVQTTAAGCIQRWANYQRHMAPSRQKERLANLDEASEGCKLFPALDARSSDLYVKKIMYSAFIQGSSNLDRHLKDYDVDTVLVTGTLTNVCCEASARDAMMLGYKVIMLSDANATQTDEQHAAALNTFSMFLGDVMQTDEMIFRLTSIAERGGDNFGVAQAAT